MRCGFLSNAVSKNAGHGWCFAAGPGKSSPMSSATAVRKVANRFGVPFLKAIKNPTVIAIFGGLKKVFPKETHRSVGKDSGQTNPVERWNNTLRQWLARYIRKTLPFSKSDVYPKIVLNLAL